MKLSLSASLLFLALHSNGVNADGLCRKDSNDAYKCGSYTGTKSYWLAVCGLNECCCDQEGGWDKMATYQRNTCADQTTTRIGCFACAGNEACRYTKDVHVGDSSCTGPEACRNMENAHVGVSSCKGEGACRNATPKESLQMHRRSLLTSSPAPIAIGDKSCNAKAACYNVVNVTIGDNSCNAVSVCKGCEAGSIVLGGTCNGVTNLYDGQVGTLTNGDRRCRACFEELRQGNYAVEVNGSSTRRRLTSSSTSRRAMAESGGVVSRCSSLAQEVKERVVDFISSHEKTVELLKGKDLSKKCREEYLSDAVGVLSDEGIFDKGCKLTIKILVKLELLKENVPEFEASFKEEVSDKLLPMGIFVGEVMATKMNCKDSSGGKNGGKGVGVGESDKGKSAKSKTGKRGKK